eukprot:81497-Chlamydomonas_euryale.AAC.2
MPPQPVLDLLPQPCGQTRSVTGPVVFLDTYAESDWPQHGGLFKGFSLPYRLYLVFVGPLALCLVRHHTLDRERVCAPLDGWTDRER